MQRDEQLSEAVPWKQLTDLEVQTPAGVMRGRVGARGPDLLFLHGNPTSGFLWRKVVGRLTDRYRCTVLDLIGMGRSSVPVSALTVPEHAAALDVAFETLGLAGATLVGHDWGAVLALDRAARHPGHRVAVCEGHLRPIPGWDDTDPGFRDLFSRLRDPQVGRAMVVEDNIFVTDVLLGSLPGLTEAERAAYLAPFAEPASRESILELIRSIPIEGEPRSVLPVMDRVRTALADADIPVLLMCGDPGSVVDASVVAWASGIGQALSVAQVGPGGHFLPEVQPEAIAAAVARWTCAERASPGSHRKSWPARSP